MAEDAPPSGNNNHTEDNSENSPTDQPQHLCLDLGDDLSRKLDMNRLGSTSSTNSNNMASGSNGPEGHKREDNPFSFKHFLRSDSSSYQHKGARPKVYCDNRSVSLGSDSNAPPNHDTKRIVPELSSALPDFVQDHLVIEQCYLGNNSSSNNYFDVNNLPDFTPNQRQTYDSSQQTGDLPPLPLDLPVRPQVGFPLDLPIAGPMSNTNEVGNSKSLPDFLTDSGAVCSHKNDALPQHSGSPESENERLRSELERTRQILMEQSRRTELLARELELVRNKEDDYTQNLIKALEQVEENLEKSKKRTTLAENTIGKQRQEIKMLKEERDSLRMINRTLRGEEAAGGHEYYQSDDVQSKRLAKELRQAANTAEHSLRSLLAGVDNLRMMAESLDNIHRIEEEKSNPFLDSDSGAGPAL